MGFWPSKSEDGLPCLEADLLLGCAREQGVGGGRSFPWAAGVSDLSQGKGWRNSAPDIPQHLQPLSYKGVWGQGKQGSFLKGRQSFSGASFRFLDLTGTAVSGAWKNIPVVLSRKWKWLRRGFKSLENQVSIRSRNPVSSPKEGRRRRQPECPWEVLPGSWPMGDMPVMVSQQKGGGGAVPEHRSVPGLLDLF